VPKTKTTNFRPRLSAAYRLSDSTVLRGGYSEFTDSGAFGPSGSINDPNGPYSLTETYFNTNVNGIAGFSFPKPFPATVPSPLISNVSVTGLPSKLDEGRIRQYNATLERAFHGMDLRASYIGLRGTGLNYSLDINKPRAGTTAFSSSRLPYPQFLSTYVTRTDGQSRYDSAQVQAQKRVGELLIDTSFTWANNQANDLNTFDPYNVTNHWTRDAADRRLYFVATAVWALPLGKGKRVFGDAQGHFNQIVSNWSFQTTGTIASGQYYSPLFTGPDPANASPTFVTALPDCIGNPDSGARTINRWFNPAAFAVPPANAGRYGTCGMNILEGYPIHVLHASLAKRIPITERLSLVFTAQVSNVFNTAHFTFPNNNISNHGAGLFSTNSVVPDYWPEHQGARQVDFKARIQW
jgi:hypothetical protein